MQASGVHGRLGATLSRCFVLPTLVNTPRQPATMKGVRLGRTS